jgi:hypothetical protein
MPTVRNVYKIVAYFAPWQKASAMDGKRVGDDHYSTSGLCPIYPGWEKADRAMAQEMDAQRQAGENPKMERRSSEFSHICLIITHTVSG